MSTAKRRLLARLAPLVGLFFCFCKPAPEQESYDDGGKSSTFSGASGSSQSPVRQKVTIPISVSKRGFNLTGTAASAYSVTLDQDPAGDPGGVSTCLSGYTATVSKANADGLEVYKDDRNCIAKLTSLTTGGVTYTSTNAGATDFTNWLRDDTALFASAGGATIRVKVIAQLDSPIAGVEAITYNFSENRDATDDKTLAESDVSAAHLITIESQEAPLFTIKTARYEGMDNATGEPQFSFKMECVDDPTAATPTSVGMTAGAAANTVCGSNDLADIEYLLVKDTFGSVLTITQAEGLFGSGGETIDVPGDQYQDSASNEGFNTITMNGPGLISVAGNEHMILILKAGMSFTYFNVDVTTISQ